MKGSKQEKIKLIKDIAKGNIDPYLMSLGILKTPDETVMLIQRDKINFVEGIQVDPDRISCSTALMPDNKR